MIKLISIFANRFSRYRAYSANEVVKQFIATTKNEINYKQEVKKALKVYEEFKGHPTIVVPFTYRECSTRQVIVQDRLFGVPFTELVTQQPQVTRSETFKNLLIDLGTQSLLSTLSGAYMQADTHPGNVLLLENGAKLGLIDFGITSEAPINRIAFFNLVSCYADYYKGHFDLEVFFEAIFHFYAPDLYRSIQAMDNLQDGLIMERMRDHVRELFEKRKNDADVIYYLNDARIRELFIRVINNDNSLGLDIKFDAGEMQAGVSTFNVMLEAFSIKPAVMAAVYSNCVEHVQKYGLKGSTQTQTLDTESVARSMETWYGRIAESNPLLFSKITKTMRS